MSELIPNAEQKEFDDGVYYSPIFINDRTQNEGFIAVAETITPLRSHIKDIVKEYEGRLRAHWSLRYTGRNIRLTLPQDSKKYPLIPIDEGGTILPFAAIKGPFYDQTKKE